MWFVDAAYGNEPTKSKSTTGFEFTFYGGAVLHNYKTRSINALSSVKIYLIDAVTTTNNYRFLRYMLQ